MAELYAVPGTVLTDIANAIREKTGEASPMEAEAMASALRGAQVCMGQLVIPSTQAATKSYTVALADEIPFTPTAFLIYRVGDMSKTDRHVQCTTYIKYGSEDMRVTLLWNNGTYTNQFYKNKLITESGQGALCKNDTQYYLYNSSTYIFPAGTYAWVAVGGNN